MLERIAGAIYWSACGTALIVLGCSVFGLIAAIATNSMGWWLPALGLVVALMLWLPAWLVRRILTSRQNS